MPWYPTHVTPQTWRSNGFYKTEGYICINIEKKLLIPTVYPSKTFAYAQCKKLNEHSITLPFNEEQNGNHFNNENS